MGSFRLLGVAVAARLMFNGAWRTLAEAEELLRILNHPGHADQSSHGRKRGRAAESQPETPSGTGIGSLPRMKKTPSVGMAAKGTNPHYGETANSGQPVYREAGKAGGKWTPEMGPVPSGAYEENCTNAVHAFEMRMRGFDVQAAPLDVLDRHGYAAGRTYKETDDQVAASYTLPNGKPHGRSFASQQWRSFDEIDREASAWPEGGRGFVTVGRHVFNVVKTGGRVKYVEGQFDASPSRVVTTQYKKKYKSSGSFSGRKEEVKLIRLDDLVPTDAMLESVVPS